MNTGIQRSSATPFGAWTTTSPIGTKIEGNRRFKKDIGAIVAAHEVPYVATLSVAHFSDFVKKVQRAKEIKGFRFLHCLTPCIPGWRIEPSKGVSIDQLAVDTGMWTLYEIDHGKARITVQTKEDSACGGIPQAAGEVPTHEGRGCAVVTDMGVPEMEGPLWGGPGRGGLPNGAHGRGACP